MCFLYNTNITFFSLLDNNSLNNLEAEISHQKQPEGRLRKDYMQHYFDTSMSPFIVSKKGKFNSQ